MERKLTRKVNITVEKLIDLLHLQMKGFKKGVEGKISKERLKVRLKELDFSDLEIKSAFEI